LDAAHHTLMNLVGVKRSCALLGRVRSTFYRRKQPTTPKKPVVRASPPNALSEPERVAVLRLLNEPQHCDLAVDQVYARTLDEGIYLCSPATMHRLLAESGSSSDRRAQRTHPAKKRPELLATRPNEIWSWDITKLHGPSRGIFFDLYVILDIFSRYVLNWLAAAHEDAELAKEFIEDAVFTQGITRDTLTIHADCPRTP
jgi:putative transposase